MILNNDPWDLIPKAAPGYFSRIRVDAETKHDIYWFRDDRNRPGLLIRINHLVPDASLKASKINIHDVTVNVIEVAEENIKAITVRLEDDQKRDIFLKLCLDLVDRILASLANEEIFEMICIRLKKWQSLFSGKFRKLLSANEIQGLYAELYFIAEMIHRDKSYDDALIKGWEGPEKTQQDFILDDMAIEIKSVSGNQRGKVRISSEDQLYTHLHSLYLRVYFLAEIYTEDNAESLNEIVRRISEQLTKDDTKEIFELKLALAGYIDIPDYDLPCFRIKDCRTYQISDDFPRITRVNLPVAIEAISYDLVLAGIEKFRVTELPDRGISK